MDKERKLGPNERELLIRFIALESVPPGGGLASSLKFFTDAEYRHQVLERAGTELEQAIEAVMGAPDNPYGDDRERIAAAILERVIDRLSHG